MYYNWTLNRHMIYSDDNDIMRTTTAFSSPAGNEGRVVFGVETSTNSVPFLDFPNGMKWMWTFFE